MIPEHDRDVVSLIAAVGLAALGYALVRTFSDQLDTDSFGSGRLLFGITISLIVIGYAAWNERTGGLLGYRLLIPPVLATLWTDGWPMLQCWVADSRCKAAASLVGPSSGVGTSAYAYWGGFAAWLLGGYMIAYWTWRRQHALSSKK